MFWGDMSAEPLVLTIPEIEEERFYVDAFEYIDFMLSLVSIHSDEKELLKRFARIGLGTSDKFDINKFSPEVQKALAEGVKETDEIILTKREHIKKIKM